MSDQTVPDPRQITDLDSLSRALSALRRRKARKGQLQLSVRDLAALTGRPPSTLHPYLRGQRLCPIDIYEDLLTALGVPASQKQRWLDAWDHLADAAAAGRRPSVSSAPKPAPRRPVDMLSDTETIRYRVLVNGNPTQCWVNIVTGDLRQVRGIDVWVNSENTRMQMSRFEEYSVSATIRFEGAIRDDAGHVVDDPIGTELAAKVPDRTPVAPATAIATRAGALTQSNAVRHIIHVASVHGEPGNGYRQILDVGRCVTTALAEAGRLDDDLARTILFPLLGTGVGGADLHRTVVSLLGAAIDHLTTGSAGPISEISLLASTQPERDACLTIFNAHPRLRRDPHR
jgi:O-acetyl-ADP-ribose deacetylase (regulator of RNase III)